MGRTSNVSDLRSRLQRKTEQERKQIEELTQSELGRLRENLRSIVESELATIERDTRDRAEATDRSVQASLDRLQSVNRILTRAWLRPTVVGLGLFLGLLGGSWGLTQWLSNDIESLLERREQMIVEIEQEQWAIEEQQRTIEEQQRTLERLKQETWGVVLREGNEGRRFVVLPPGTSKAQRWTVGGRPAIVLSSE